MPRYKLLHSGSFVDAETPSGTVDGNNATFTLAYVPSAAASLQLFINGQLLIAGGVDYTLEAATITVNSPPPGGSVIIAWYRH